MEGPRVLVVCAYCRKTISDQRGAATDVSHGMCASCADHYERLWQGMPLSEYLETIDHPVIMMNGDGAVVAVNEKLAARFGREKGEMRGLLEGEAMACVHSLLPEGCGKTVHCRECTVRRAVESVAKTGKPLERIPAYLDTKDGRVNLRISVRTKDGLFRVVVEEMKTAEPKAGEA
ncbi:MAG TPA: hypothetical protein VF841_20245 [Anaeromyxobacter sp.]